MNNGDYSQVFVARLLHSVNKYKPGIADFSIPVIMNDSGLLQTQTIQNNTSKLVNQDKSNIAVSSSTVTKSIKITIPPEIVYFYPTKVIPKGTVFFVLFIGSDINKPIIVGRDINGYITTKENNNN